jgi:hypothetical protein
MPKKLTPADVDGTTTTDKETKVVKTPRVKKTLAVATEKSADKTSKPDASPNVQKIQQPSTVWPFQLDYVEDWAYFQGAFFTGRLPKNN